MTFHRKQKGSMSMRIMMRPTAATAAFIMSLFAALSCTHAFLPTTRTATKLIARPTAALNMVQNRGLEVRRDTATPTEGDMTLYCKAGPDGTLLGDCPFAQYVRLVLEEKGLEYELQPTVQDTKPVWLVEYYNGKLPALRHGKECYVESDVIAEYLDFFFPQPALTAKKQETAAAEEAVAGLFPATAKYLKHTPDGDADDAELLEVLETKLAALEQHLQRSEERTGPFLVGDGTAVTLVDCSLVPKLYHLQTGVTAFKGQIVADKLVAEYPALQSYMNTMFERSSFQKTVYPKETVAWGWGNARN